MNDLEAVSLICTILANVVVVVSVILIIWQLVEARRATQAQAYSFVVERLQDEEVRDARRIVFKKLKEKPLENWTEEERKTAEKVCHTYDAVGIMVRHKLLPREIVIDSWGNSLLHSWDILAPLVENYRQEFDAIETWDDYQWLASEAKKHLSR